MTVLQQGQELVTAFFNALRLRQLDTCQSNLAQLNQLAEEASQWLPWCGYLQGILVFERDRDFAESERIFTALLQGDLTPTLEGRVLRALGRGYQVQGRWAEAVDVYHRSLDVFINLEQPVEQARAYKQMAIASRQGYNQGVFDEAALMQALNYGKKALAVLEPLATEDESIRWEIGSVYNTLGAVSMHLERWDDAIAAYSRDLDVCRDLDDRHGMGLTYGNLGEIYQKQGPESWQHAQHAFEQALILIGESGNRYEEAEALANLAYFHQAAGHLLEAIKHYSAAVELIESMRSGISSFEVRAGYFATVNDTYANLVTACLEADEVASAFRYVEMARARSFLDSLMVETSDLPRDFFAGTVSLQDVQRALPEDAILLEYYTTGMIEHVDERLRSERASRRHRYPAAKTWLFAITKTGVEIVDTGLSPNVLLPRRIGEVVERHFLKDNMRRHLYRALIAPVEQLLRHKRWLYLVPHGPLHYLPFQALLQEQGDTLMQADGPALVYCPSASILLYERQTKRPAPVSSCLAIGYNNGEVQGLRFAEEEANRVVQLVGGESVTGMQAKKPLILKVATDYRFIHFSCHGEFQPDAPMQSYLQTGLDERLTAHDVVQDLRLNADLVVMSACESGLSRIRRGDELVGFTRALMHANARAIIASLWRVDELSTALLVQAFYREVMEGADFATALKKAQLFLKELSRREAEQLLGQHLSSGDGDERLFAEPFYWAPFVLVATLGALKPSTQALYGQGADLNSETG